MSDTNMTFSDWIDSLTDDERETLCAYDAWKEGARQILNALVERGYISEQTMKLALDNNINECSCDLRTKLVGSGCWVCNPDYYEDLCGNINDEMARNEVPADQPVDSTEDYEKRA
jgi:hypothetical protein